MTVEKRKQQLRERIVVGCFIILTVCGMIAGAGAKEGRKNSEMIEATEDVNRFDMEDVVVEPVEPTYRCEWLNEEFSQSDFELLCRTTHEEGKRQDEETRYMIALTILNRYGSGFGETLHEVVYDAYQVTDFEGFETAEWTEQTEQCVLRALRENIHPHDMYYFRTAHYHRFGVPYMKSGTLYFSVED